MSDYHCYHYYHHHYHLYHYRFQDDYFNHLTGHQFSWGDASKKAKSIFGSRTVNYHAQKNFIFLLYFYDVYDINPRKKIGVSIAYSWKAKVFIEFYYFIKKRWWNPFFYTFLFQNRPSSLKERKDIEHLWNYKIIAVQASSYEQYNQNTFFRFMVWRT